MRTLITCASTTLDPRCSAQNSPVQVAASKESTRNSLSTLLTIRSARCVGSAIACGSRAVSYTHLDVYKRQVQSHAVYSTVQYSMFVTILCIKCRSNLSCFQRRRKTQNKFVLVDIFFTIYFRKIYLIYRNY